MFDRFGGKTVKIDSHSANEEKIREVQIIYFVLL